MCEAKKDGTQVNGMWGISDVVVSNARIHRNVRSAQAACGVLLTRRSIIECQEGTRVFLDAVCGIGQPAVPGLRRLEKAGHRPVRDGEGYLNCPVGSSEALRDSNV